MQKRTNPSGSFTTSRRATRTATALPAIVLALLMFPAQAAHGQVFSVLHSFAGGSDGEYPYAGVSVGSAGTLYGTAVQGGTHGDGVAFELKQRGTGWIFTPLYEFGASNADGRYPAGGITVQSGVLFGTTANGGQGCSGLGCGTVYELRPPPTACKSAICYYDETILWRFQGPDGAFPFYVTPIFDSSGNIYGTTMEGGAGGGFGTVWELTPSSGGYIENVLYSFINGNDGEFPSTSLIFDSSGNLYSTTTAGIDMSGNTLFELSPSNGGWIENTVFSFWPVGGVEDANNVIMDQSGNLYGALSTGGSGGSGVVYELMRTSGGWNISLLSNFPTNGGCATPFAGVTLQGGNLYGTCLNGGAHGWGEVFELSNTGGTWSLTDLYDFTDGSDGAAPSSNVVFDSHGNMFGTTVRGGDPSCNNGYGCGTVWEITGLNDR